MRAVLLFGQRVIDAAGRSAVHRERKEAQSQFLGFAQNWVNAEGAAKVVNISETTRSRINNAVRIGQANGESVFRIADRIHEETGGAIGARRALVIARTETHFASSAASELALEALDIPGIKREWIAAEDHRTRATHVDANGQVRGLGEAFDVGGFKLRYPGDPLGPAREVIQCRCVPAAVFDDEALEGDEPLDALPGPLDAIEEPVMSAVDRRAKDWTLRNGRSTGDEFMRIVDRNGNTSFQFTGDEVSVSMSDDAAQTLGTGRGYTIHHNHPGSEGSIIRTLSLEDLLSTSNYRGVDRILAYAHDGSVFEGWARRSSQRLIDLHEFGVSQVGEVFRPAAKARTITKAQASDLFYHLVNAGLAEVGAIRYRVRLSAAPRRLLEEKWPELAEPFKEFVERLRAFDAGRLD